MAEFTAESLKQMLIDVLSGPNSGAGKAAGTAVVKDIAPDMGAFTKSASEFVGLLTKELPQLATGFLNVRDASTAAKNSLYAIGGVAERFGGILGKAVNISGKLLEEYRELGNQANKIGIGQLDYAQLTAEAQKAGFKNGKDYLDQLAKTAGNSLKTIDQSNELSSRKFLDFAKDVQGTPQAQKLKSLAGVSPEEIAQIAAIAAGGKTTQLNSKEGKDDLLAKTAEMSNNINRLSTVTGQSREQIIASMQEYNKSARGQLELQAVGNDQTRDALQQSRVATAGLGQSMQGITSTIIAGGALNKEQRTQLQVSTGGRAGQYMRAARDVRRTAGLAEDDPQKQAAAERLRTEVARANDYQNSKQFAQRALITQDPAQKAAYEKAQAENVQKFGQGATQRATGLSPEEAQRAQLVGLGDAAISGRTQEGRDRPYGAAGTQNEGARTTQALNSVYESARMNAASASGELRKLNTELGQSPEKINAVRQTLERAFGNNTNQDESDKRMSGAGKKLTEYVAPGASSKVVEERKAAGEGPKRDQGTRAHGTLGEIGQVSEPKDVVAKLHKGETVVTPEQLKNLLSGSASNAISDVMKSATTNQPASKGLDVSKITSGLKEITTTISSVSGGGSTTRSSVENDDAKAAKKELEAIKTQFQTEKNDIRTQVKGNLGADAKPADIMRAMRDNPQAKALEARMQEATAKLSTRISDGTTTKTVTEPNTKSVSGSTTSKTVTDLGSRTSMMDDIKKNMSQGMSQAKARDMALKAMEEANATRYKINNSTESGINKTKINDIEPMNSESISDKLSSIKPKKEAKDNFEIQPEIEEPQFEEQSNKVGLNDLNEQLIQLNTSIRQLIQHSAESVETAGKQVKATKGLSGNRFA